MKFAKTLEVQPELITENLHGYLLECAAKELDVPVSEISDIQIIKRSVDARRRGHAKLIFKLALEMENPPEFLEIYRKPHEYAVPAVSAGIGKHPVIIGAGPAGLFAGIILAEAGLEPVIIERGKTVDKRREDIERFFRTRHPDTESNYLYGEGGAGTWSDGKLFTRIRDERCSYVLKEFVAAGASEEILYFSHPHVGSDKLPQIIANIRNKIISLGGQFIWSSKVEKINAGEKFESAVLANGDIIEGPACIVACGHSARELIEELAKIAEYRMKPFQIGCRVEHEQSMINRSMYGIENPCKFLGAAEYSFAVSGTAATFCMCPGGEIIPAVCEYGRLSTNGMSNALRDGKFSNSAVITSLPEEMFRNIRCAYEFIRSLEHSAFRAGGGNYCMPAQNVKDFIHARSGKLLRSETSYRLGTVAERVDLLLPGHIADKLRKTLSVFERLCPGFSRYGILEGLETRVSNPVRFCRNPETLESSVKNLYIAGEGGGVAGGIVSAAVDGIKVAEAILKNNN